MKRASDVDYGGQMGVGEVPVKGPKRLKQLFQTRCNPKLNYQLIQKHKTNPQFRRLLIELGLDALLELRVTRLHRELCATLASKVDVSHKSLKVHGKRIPLTYASVTKVLGLPSFGDNEVPNVYQHNPNVGTACVRFNLDASGKVSLYTLQSYLEQATNFGDEFKAKFILFTIGTLLRPTTNVHLHYREYIPFLLHMSNLNSYNWGKFLLDGLLEAIRVYQIKGARSLGGCLLYLQLLYTHCISPVKLSLPDELYVATPCLRSWNDERVSTVLKLMRSTGGLESNEVIVQTNGIPSTSMEENPVLPQLLMHHCLIDRIRRHISDKEIELAEKLDDLRRRVEVIANKVGTLEALWIFNNASTWPAAGPPAPQNLH